MEQAVIELRGVRPDDFGFTVVGTDIGINADGTSGSVTYEDTIVRGDQGWRISHRRILARRTALGAR
jgi:hypothetical protein